MEQMGIMQDRAYSEGWWTRWRVASYAPPSVTDHYRIRKAWYDGWVDADRRIRYDLIRNLARAMDVCAGR